MIQHDGKFSIAIGRSRKEIRWKNEEWLWSAFLDRIKETHRTHESYLEYMSGKKPWQDEIKDVGGYVGGRLTGGRRQRNSVVCRQLVTLDLDFAPVSVWQDFAFNYGNAAAIYSTHKHSEETPRYRLIIPLDREVSADEWEAISRRIAGNMGIEIFDPTTFQAHRLMYWPSTAKDGDYMFEYQDGPWLCADDVLGSYRDWHDTSEWPVSVKQKDLVLHNMKKQGDPLEKPGIIGAFCRTYNIHEVIEKYLVGVYETCDQEDRYTFTGGSTAAGLIVYDDKYAYSHHGTDPCSGKLCNAFDLVRLHKFGLMDEDSRDGTPVNKLPSFGAMQREVLKDSEVRKLIGVERLQDAFNDFQDDESVGTAEGGEEAKDVAPEEINTDWLGEMDVDARGNYTNTIKNVTLILENDPRLKGCFGFNAFERRRVVHKNLPWRKDCKDNSYLKDSDEINLIKFVELHYKISGRQAVKDAFCVFTESQVFLPVQDYFREIKWDGEPRLDTLFVDFLGAEDSDYTRAVTRKTFTAAVARTFRPGVKFDTMTVLVGSQGIGKSTLLARMGKGWFSDSFGSVHSKEAAELIQGYLIVEIGELAGLKKADIDAIKLFMSKTQDTYRPAYGRETVTNKRHGIMVGTTNDSGFLRDHSGNRRFWPVVCEECAPIKSVFKDMPDWFVDQVWSEAVEYFDHGESLILEGETAEKAKEIQANHLEKDEREGLIASFLEILLPEDWDKKDTFERKSYIMDFLDEKEIDAGTLKRTSICVPEIWCELLNGHRREMTTQNTKPIHSILRGLPGWKETKRKWCPNYGLQRVYIRV